MKLFHGTTDKHLKKIQRDGLSSKRYVAGEDGIWLTDWSEAAEWFGGIKVDEEGGRLLICEVKAKPKDLSPDFMSYDMPMYEVLQEYGCDTGDIEKSDECWRDKIKKGEVPFPKNKHDWEPV